MYNKTIPSSQVSDKASDILIFTHRDEDSDGEQVTVQFWVNELWFGETMTFQSLSAARNFIRDFTPISAADYVERLAQDEL